MTAAYELAKGGIGVEVYEAASQVGGLARTIELWNQNVDLGPHRFFSSDPRVNSLWLEVVGQDYQIVDRLTRIYYKHRFFSYPLKPFDALRNLGVIEAARCAISYASEQFSSTPLDGSFENWVVNRFGRRLFEIFFKTYSEKLWGISCKELDDDFAAQRIKKLSLFEAVKNSLVAGRTTHKTLVEQFAYPNGGTGSVYERMKRFVEAHGGRVSCNTPIKRVITRDSQAFGVELLDGTIKQYDHVVSSMPLSLMVTRLEEAPENIRQLALSLKFRNTILVYLNVQATDLFPDNWLYIHSSDLRMGRVTNFRNWVPGLYKEEKTTIVVTEYWCYDDDSIWTATDDELIDLGKQEMRKTGLIGNAAISDGYVFKIRRCYPVYDRGYKDRLKPIEQYLGTIANLHVIGRYGAFKYNNQDHSILMGLLAAENISEGTRHNLWGINTDYEDYREKSTITATGLVKEV